MVLNLKSTLQAVDKDFASDDPIADATEVYGGKEFYDDRAIYDLLDVDNDCTNAGGHLFLTQCGETRCVHCRKRVT